MLHVVERKWVYFALSGLLIVPGVIFLLIGGLKPGIEFKGGTLLDASFAGDPPSVSEVQGVMTTLGSGEAVVQAAEGGRIEIRTFEMKPDEVSSASKALQDKFGASTKVDSSVVSPSFSGELIQNAVKSITFASLLIVFLIAFAFRNFGWAAFRYGIAAIIALLHDAAVVLGLFAILGYFFNVEIDSLFVTAVLTIIGFSVHDTIVVFDRIRENLRRGISPSFDVTVNESLLQTLGRSLTTSLTVIFTLLAMLLIGGTTIRPFILVLLVGITSGTYSSIAVASQLLVVWEHGTFAKPFRGLRNWFGGRREAPAPGPAGD